MNKNLFSVAAGAVAALMVATSAHAVTTVTASGSGPRTYAQDVADVTIPGAIVVDFDNPNAAGFNFTFTPGPGAGQIGQGDNGPEWLNIGFSPADNHFAVMKGCTTTCGDNTGTGVFTSVQPLQSISFLWGSPDTHNFLRVGVNNGILFIGSDIDGPGQTVLLTGALPAGNAERVYLTFSGDAVYQVQFGSINNSMEIDRISAVIPEPTTWAMLLMGFFGLGAAIRSRRSSAARTFA